MIFYFSGTGNTRWAAGYIARALNDQCICITDEQSLSQLSSETHGTLLSYAVAPDERIGFAFPVYGWQPPGIFMEFLRRIQFKGASGTYCYFVCTCGDDIGRTRDILQKELQPHQLTLQAGLSLLMPDCYISLPGFDVDSAEERTTKLAQAPAILDGFIERIRHSEKNCFQLKPGTFPAFKTYVLGNLFRRFLMGDKPFHATSACIGCGKCTQSCPVGNIRLEKGLPRWQGHCTGCLACYHTCPFKAIQYGNRTKGKGQYLHDTYVNPEQR